VSDSRLLDLATLLWTAISDGGLERWSDGAEKTLGPVWARIRTHRKRGGHSEVPVSCDELYLSLLGLLISDPAARPLVTGLTRERMPPGASP
jgi:Rps23 Pro-64 3,4-dihydroxylase Tpa1-like proline 4-hydroxylase